MTARGAFAAWALIAAAACSTSGPANVTSGDVCGHCRMVVSNPRFAGQIAAPGEEPVFFDDIGCLAKALAGGRSREFAYVADHRTGAWVRAGDAIYTRVPTLDTPMGSHLIAHADAASRRQDPDAVSGTLLSAADVFDRKEGGSAHGS